MSNMENTKNISTKKELRAQEREKLMEETNKVLQIEKWKRYGVWSLVIISVAVLFTGVFNLVGNSISKEENKPTISSDDRVKGNTASQIVVMEYSDYQCPACKYYQSIANQLTTEYKDKIVFVYRHFPLEQHKNAEKAAYTAEAAGLQGKFWEMSDLLFEKQEEWSEKSNSEEIFKSYASKLGLDPKKFTDDIISSGVKEKVDRDRQSGKIIGVNATPTFYLNGVKLRYIRNYDDFKKIVEEKLQSQ